MHRSVPKGNLNGKVWQSGEAETAIEERTKAFREYEKNKAPETLQIFHAVQDCTDQTIADSKRRYVRDNMGGR